MPRISFYCGNGSNNALVTFPSGASFYFSYATCVAFRYGGALYVSENAYSATTGKHLHAIDGGNKAGRLPRADFERELTRTLYAHQLG